MADEKPTITYNGYATADADKTSLIIRRGDTVITATVDKTESVDASALLDRHERIVSANQTYLNQLRAKSTGKVRQPLPPADVSKLIRASVQEVSK